jgi:phosphoglycolate phosphatase
MPTTPPRLILWDIDGTLLRGGSAAGEVFDQAVEAALGRHPGAHGVTMGGKTDPQIALEILAFAEVLEAEAHGHLPNVIGQLEQKLAERADDLRRDGYVCPGVEKVLARLADEPGVVQSVLTGNTRVNAALKLGVFGLDGWLDLDIGAFGSDHADRRLLVPIARERSGLDASATVWVVGDTAHDLACARAGGARCLLVGTGHAAYEDLATLDADAVLPDLTDTDAVIDLLLRD